MHYLLIKGLLPYSGPGDVVGALVGSTELESSQIGNIKIDRKEEETVAEVEIEAPRTSYRPEGITHVGNAEVIAARWTEEDYRDLRRYIRGFGELVQLEREEEMRRHEEEIGQLTGRERQEKGRALLEMSGKDSGEDLGGKRMVKFTRSRNGQKLPENELAVGDLVMISKRDPLRDDNPTGTVAEKTGRSLTVAFEDPPHDLVYGGGLRIDLYVNDITYQRMLDALRELPFHSSPQFVRRLLGSGGLQEAHEVDLEFQNGELDSSQREAASRAMGSDTFFCVHGPPGTGKTTTLAEIIHQLSLREEKVLGTAASNTAVDNLVEFLSETSLDVVRVGHPARITPALRHSSLDYRIQDNEKYERSRQLREKAFSLKEEQEGYQVPTGKYRRGLSDDQIRQLARKGAGTRGISPRKIEQMAEWLSLQEEIDHLFEESRRLEEEAIDEILNSCDVVCTTNSTAGSQLMAGREFDVLAIDEATQATEPSCLIPLSKVDRAVLAGDHRQLPPTIISKEAEEGLQATLFERLVDRAGDKVTEMLKVQYRMHEDIMEFPGEHFYEGKLKAAEEVRFHTLSDLGARFEGLDKRWLREALNPSRPAFFLDTRDLPCGERQRPGSTSRENPGEAELVSEILSGLLREIPEKRVGVISPYDDQIDMLNSRWDREDLEIQTVDGFQGREKEVIVLSFVRSNSEGQLGFLTDFRRLNVSITRARRKLIMVGDSSTLRVNPTYRDLLTYLDERDGRMILNQSILEKTG